MSERVDVLAVGLHPDDVELGCGGTVALLVEGGRRVGVAVLTRGEAGTRGTVKERREEAEAAAEVLGAATFDMLDLGDGGVATNRAAEDEVIELLRRRRPELILGPTPADRHPDHRRGHRLLADAAFYSGLARRGEGAPHRPAAVWSYMQHDPFTPDLVVDVSSTWERKLEALACYRSQLHQPDAAGERDEPVTKVSTPEFRAAMEGRARHFGLLVGAAYGEPFTTPLPLAIRDPWTLLPGGVR